MRPNWLSPNSTRDNESRSSRWSTRLRRSAYASLGAGLALVGLVAFATPTYAHSNTIIGKPACATPLGTGYAVTWVIANDYNLTENATVVSVTDNGVPLDLTANPITPAGPYAIPATPNSGVPVSQWSHVKVTQTLPANAVQGTLVMTVHGHWSDGHQQNDVSATASLDINCSAPTQTIAGHIYLCQSGQATTNEVSGGTVSATGPQTVPSQGNPLNPVNVAAGGYTMTATPPPGYTMVTCGGSSTPNSDGSSATEPVTVPQGGAGVGIFYVTTPTTTPTTTATTVPTTTPTTGPVTSPSQTTPTTVATTPATSTSTAPSSLAFTGAPVGKEWMFGIGALILGAGLMLASRLRIRKPRHAASKE